MGRLDGKVALITGAARGQGRSHAVVLAREGAQIVATDLCENIAPAPYDLATEADLDETVRLVEALDRRCLGIKADARSREQMDAVVAQAVAELGRIDVLAINHGIAIPAPWDQITEENWDATVETNLTAVWRTAMAVIPQMVEQGGGSVVITSSTAGLTSMYGQSSYGASKHAVVGLMRNLAAELAPHWVRVNCVCPTNTATPMTHCEAARELFTGRAGATIDDMRWISQTHLMLPIPWLECRDISNAVLFLASDEARCITGVALPVDGGTLGQPPGIPPIGMEKLGELGFTM